MNDQPPGTRASRLIVISGPSGSGKSTLVRRVLNDSNLRARRSVSSTTRQPRTGERDGIDYDFLSREQFEEKIANGEFLEWAEVHGNLYGTPRQPVVKVLNQGYCVFLVIDVQGALQVLQNLPECLLVFIHPPDFETLELRLRDRGTESDAIIQKRLENARVELSQAHHYHHAIVNHDLDQAFEELVHLLIEQGCGQGESTDA